MKQIILFIVPLLIGFITQSAPGEQTLAFADILADNMVLQRGEPVVCWGRAKPGAQVEILLTQSRADAADLAGEAALNRPEEKPFTPSSSAIDTVHIAYVEEHPAPFQAVRKTVRADATGHWKTTLGVHKASFTPAYLVAKSLDESAAIQNLLIGEVWIASGQSNMAFGNTHDKMWENHGLIFNGVRIARIGGDAGEPQERLIGVNNNFSWMVCRDGAVDRVSTIPYLFAQYLHRRLKVPVGMINIAEGGTYAREWCDRTVLEKIDSPTLKHQMAIHDKKIVDDPQAKNSRGPASLFNARVYPIRQLPVAGVIYFQGENEALTGDVPQYPKTFPGVIASFRTALGQADLPFGIITLQGLGSSKGYSYSGYSVVREIHLKTHEATPGTGYIVAHDIGGGVHPTCKRPVAERTVYWALRDVYGLYPKAKKTRIQSVKFTDDHAVVTFMGLQLDHGEWTRVDQVQLESNNQQEVAGFMIAGVDRAWYPGRVSGVLGQPGALAISNPMVKHPVALRYAWEGWSKGNLGSWIDPIPPYRTDDWPVLAADKVYDPASGKPSTQEIRYARAHDAENRLLELPLQRGATEAGVNLTKRYAHPKPMLLAMLSAMNTLLDQFNVETYAALAPELRKTALYKIPPRYWRRDRYSVARRAKWGWLIERFIRLGTLPDDMRNTLDNPAVKAKLQTLRNAVADLQEELRKTPDPTPMTIDDMLNQVLPVMEKEKETLLKNGVDLRKLETNMRAIPF